MPKTLLNLPRKISFKFPDDHHHGYPRDKAADARIVMAIKYSIPGITNEPVTNASAVFGSRQPDECP
jgi:hypothetical protein